MFLSQGWGSREWVISFMVALVWIIHFLWKLPLSVNNLNARKASIFSGGNHGQHPDDQGSVLGHTQQGHGGSELWGGRCLCIAGREQMCLFFLKRFSGHSIWCAKPLDRHSWNGCYNFSSVRWFLILILICILSLFFELLPLDFYVAQVWAWKIMWWIGWAGAFSDLFLLYKLARDLFLLYKLARDLFLLCKLALLKSQTIILCIFRKSTCGNDSILRSIPIYFAQQSVAQSIVVSRPQIIGPQKNAYIAINWNMD